MALTFSNIIYDEAGLPDVDTDAAGTVDSNVASLSTALTTKIGALSLSSQYYTGANAVTQYAELTNFISDPNAGPTNYSLASNTSGSGFSLVDGAGVATGLYVGATEIYLYATSDPNVVVGRIGNSTSGKIAMIVALDQTKDGTGHVTGTDLGIEMFAPLTNSDGAHVDDGDTTSMLSGVLFVYELHNTISIVPFNDFSGVPSGQDAYALIGPSDNSSGVDLLATGYTGTTPGTVNVSTQGLGANAQTVDNGASLRIDVVNANSADFALQQGNPPGAHSDVNISYQGHVQVIEASFELTQTNPTGKAASLTVSAWEVSSDLKGHAFSTDAAASEGTLIHITTTNVIIRDNSGNDITAAFKTSGGTITQSSDGNSVLITGLTALEHVDFTADSQFDRFTVTNTQTSPSDKTTFDVGDIRVSTITGGSGHDSGDLGPSLIFEDGGPSVALQSDPSAAITIDESTLGTAGKGSADFSGLFDVHYGPDGAASSTPLTYALGIKSTGVDSGLKDTATGYEIFLYKDGSDVVGRVGSDATTANPAGQIDFRISVDTSGNVTFQQDYAVVHSDPNATDESLTLAASNLITLTATAHDHDGDSASSPAANIATLFTILDDEPASLGTASNVIVGNNTSATDPDGAGPLLAGKGTGAVTTYDAGNDGVGSYTIVGPADATGDYTWAYGSGGTDHSTIIESFKGTPLFSLALNSATGGYTMTMLGTLPYGHVDLNATNIKAGGPTGSIDVGTINAGGDYVQISGTTNNGASVGSVNASNGNVGVVNGNLDGGEALIFSLYTSSNTLVPLYGLDMGTKTAQGATYHLYGVLDSDHTTVVDLGVQSLLKGGTIHYAGNVLLDSIIVQETAGNAVKIGLAGIHLLTPPDDVAFQYTAKLVDGDGDAVTTTINLFIDGNNDGSVDTLHPNFV